MAKALLIAEKPSLMRTIQAVYNKMSMNDSIDFASFVGHIIRRQTPDEYCEEWARKPWSLDVLPMLPEKYLFEVSPNVTDVYNKLVSMIKTGNYEYIINACDPDREGQAIFQYFYDYAGLTLPIKRFWTNDLSSASVEKALRNLRTYDDGLEPNLKLMTEAARLRGEEDIDIGMNFTRGATVKLRTKANVGRVKTAALKIVVIREHELRNFKPKTSYELEAINEYNKSKFQSTLIDDDGYVRFDKKEDADEIISKLGNTAIITDVSKTRVRTEAPQLYKLSALQQEAGNVYGLSAEEVKNIAQSLYEKKIISYPRTDNPYVGTELTKSFKAMINTVTSLPELSKYAGTIDPVTISRVSKSSKYINDKKMAESGHYAIVPTAGNSISYNSLSDFELKVYTLICKRFLAIFMPAKEDTKTVILSENKDSKFKSTGTKTNSLGFLELYGYSPNEVILPEVKKGDTLNVTEFNLVEKVTRPPQRYTDTSLIGVMDNPVKFLEDNNLKSVMTKIKGIGTEATRTGIISELVKNGYIEIKKKGKANQVFATEAGIKLIEALGNHRITQVDLTGYWETKLEDVALGKMTPEEFKKEEVQFINEGLAELKQLKPIGNNSGGNREVICSCPKCGKNVVAGNNYYFCEEYKNPCDFIVGKTILGAKLSEAELKKVLSGKESKTMNFSYNGTKWKGTLEYKDGKVSLVKKESKVKELDLTCPSCGKKLKNTGKYYICEDYKKPCEFILPIEQNGAKFTEDDVAKLLAGETLERNFTWKSGKSSTNKVSIVDNKLKIHFEKK